MFIVKHKPTGQYYKRGNIRSWYDSKLVGKGEATVYRSKGGATMSVGKMVFDDKPTKIRGVTRKRTHYVLDNTVWEIIPVEIKEE